MHEVDCSGCGKRHVLSADQARKQRVVRCDCGQFVRMDRALLDRRSDPAPAPLTQAEAADALSAATALRATSSKARATQASLSGQERSSQAVPSLSPAPLRPSGAPPSGDKPLWYVDLGGTETVEMTIEQLIIARRSGKLGEGALVWRAGMPRWRPVGELIPTSSTALATPVPVAPVPVAPALATPRPFSTSSRPVPPLPPVPIPAPSALRRPSQPPPAVEPPPAILGSYERPAPTLEFALEQPVLTAVREPSRPALRANLEPRISEPPRAAAAPPPRALTPLPARPPTSVLQRLATPTPLPQRSPTPVPQRTPTPVPQRTPTPVPRAPSASSVVVPLPAPPPPPRSAVSTAPVTLPPAALDHSDLVGEGLRWRTISLALLLCIAASGSGAFLVRTLRVHHQPLALTPTSVPTLPASAFAHVTSPVSVEVHAALAAEPAPKVVDVSSLSVEHVAPRTQPRPASTPKANPPSAESNPVNEQQRAAEQPKNSDIPAPAASNSHTAADSSGAKKPAAPSGAESEL